MESVDRALYHTNSIMDLKQPSSAFYMPNGSFFPCEVTSYKSELLPDQYGTACRKQIFFTQGTENACRKQVASSPFDHLEPFALHDHRVDLSSNLTVLRNSNGTTVNARIPPLEFSLFSSSLPELYTRILEASSKNTHFDHSDEEETLTSLEEIEAQTIGDLLPDKDDLFCGVTDGLEFAMQPNNGGAVGELDLFRNVGGMDLEDSDFSGTILEEEHPFTLHPDSLKNKTDYSSAQLKFDTWGSSPNLHHHSLGEYKDGFMNNSQHLHRVISSNGQQGSVFGSVGNGSSPIWGNSYHTQSPTTMWPNINGTRHLHGSLSPMLKTPLTSNNNPTIWDRHQPYASETSSIFHSGSWGNSGISKSPLHSVDFVPHNIFPIVGGRNCMDHLPIPSTVLGVRIQSHHQRCMMFPGRGQRLPGLCSFDPPNERVRIRRNEGASSQANKKQFELDIERIIQGEDSRITLMIKNIPNKYTSKMLLATIDELHRGTYDFIYLPIDFKNKCNVGYAFINMTDPSHIIPFYKAFNGKKWEKFNSEKVASLAYARIQGKAALIAHFQNSSLMNEDKRCQPILFNTEGPNAGDQVPFPMGANVRSSRAGKTRINSIEEKKSHLGGGDHSYTKKVESTNSN